MKFIERLKTDRKFLLIAIGLVVAIFLVPYLTIPALILWWFYKKSKFSRKSKIIATSSVGGLFAILILWFGIAYANDAQPHLTVTEPVATSTIQAPQVTIKGTYSPADRTIEVNGQTITAKNGNFQTVYQLTKGENKIDVQAGNLKWTHVYLDVTRELTDAEKAALITPTSAKENVKKSTKKSNPNTDNIAPKILGACSTASTGNYVVTNCVNVQLADSSSPSRLVYVVIDPSNDSPKAKVQTVATQASALCGKISDCFVDIFDNTQAANEQYKEDLLSQAAVKQYIKDPKNDDATTLTTDHTVANFTPPDSFTYLFIPTPTPRATPTPIAYDANGFQEDAQRVTVADIAKVPSSYEGKKVTFTCTVLSFPKDSSGNAAGLNCSDPNDYSSILQVSMGTFDSSVNINKDDTVAIYGIGQGSASGTNAFGGQVSEAVVLEIHLKDNTTGYNE